MLNIINRISLSKKSKKLIKKLKREKGEFTVKTWSEINKSVKNEISRKLLFHHNPYCVYCERLLLGTGNQIDHFVNKSNFPQFTFNTINLFYSCTYCNSSVRKGQKITVVAPINNNYKLCTFNIVHPLIHNPDAEILYQDTDKIYFDRINSSVLGNNTIDFFGWDDRQMTMLRARTLLNERLNRISDKDNRMLIEEIISYR
ncbi:hypothetical protein LPB248_01260 [Flavobacterium sp. LPB0248]|uniref:hypothetical protein n=1 Tax=Flavobacterium sp. LPB0248 TaxID=2614441 RepID=UPI0015A688F9|nr:hypothetical protein [Flavobacterium sp. LPB0248]QLC64951.1 hypothetical protein LPB248_01260 [Flavobacterium sp. LPB0248]